MKLFKVQIQTSGVYFNYDRNGYIGIYDRPLRKNTFEWLNLPKNYPSRVNYETTKNV